MGRPRRDSRQQNGITLRGLSQPTFATKSAVVQTWQWRAVTPACDPRRMFVPTRLRAAACPVGRARQAVYLRRSIRSSHQVLELCQIVNGRVELTHTGTEVRRGVRRKLADEILASVRVHPSTCC